MSQDTFRWFILYVFKHSMCPFLFISVLDYPCNLLQVDKEFLATKLTSRVMKTTWGGNTEEVVVTNNIQQAESTRDALAKGIYSRIFDFLVEVCTVYR